MNNTKYLLIAIATFCALGLIVMGFFLFVIYLPSKDKAEQDLKQQELDLQKDALEDVAREKKQQQNERKRQEAEKAADQEGYANCYQEKLNIIIDTPGNPTANDVAAMTDLIKDICSSQYPLAIP